MIKLEDNPELVAYIESLLNQGKTVELKVEHKREPKRDFVSVVTINRQLCFKNEI